MSIRVLVADDHPVVREGLHGMISREADLAWVGAVADAHALLEAVRATSPDVVLLDLRMPNGGGLAALRQMQQAERRPACVVLSSYEEATQVRAAVEAGAQGYLVKGSDYGSIISAIRAVARGERVISPSLLPILFDTVAHQSEGRIRAESGLDHEALQVLSAIAAGATTSEIASQIALSEVTVKRRIQELVDRLGVRNRTQAVAEAVRRGWI